MLMILVLQHREKRCVTIVLAPEVFDDICITRERFFRFEASSTSISLNGELESDDCALARCFRSRCFDS